MQTRMAGLGDCEQASQALHEMPTWLHSNFWVGPRTRYRTSQSSSFLEYSGKKEKKPQIRGFWITFTRCVQCRHQWSCAMHILGTINFWDFQNLTFRCEIWISCPNCSVGYYEQCAKFYRRISHVWYCGANQWLGLLLRRRVCGQIRKEIDESLGHVTLPA